MSASLLAAACSTEPCILLPSHGMEAEVRTLGGLPAAEGATAKAHRGADTEALQRMDDLVFTGVHEPGTYRLTVTKPGYQFAEIEGIRVNGDACGVETTNVPVTLLPQ